MGRRKKEQNVIPVKNLFSLLDVDNDLQDLPDAAKLEKGTKGNKKDRLIRLWRFLYEYTDEKHRITTQEIIKLFEKKYGMEVNRKTVKDDGETLHDAGYSVEINKSANNQYYMTKREFTIPELKLLIDAVAATQFISKQTTMDLTDKLFRLMSVHQAQEMGSYVHVDYGVKADDDSIYQVIAAVSEAISKNKKIRFLYTTYNANKELVIKNDGEKYEFSPYMLRWNMDHYYMVGYSDKHEKVNQFRVDRVYGDVEITDEDAVPKPPDFKENEYGKNIFGMMNDGKPVKVTLRCNGDRMKDIIDVFGINVETKALARSDRFDVHVPVYLSPNFFKWIFGFHGEIIIKSPQKVVDQYLQSLIDALEVYEKGI
ncbi:MAG: WYL domain-containing protein [Selenomonadales bacterium]|nr:WYL domain-containing protein [Selenomonadales bacterium]